MKVSEILRGGGFAKDASDCPRDAGQIQRVPPFNVACVFQVLSTRVALAAVHSLVDQLRYQASVATDLRQLCHEAIQEGGG